MTIYARIDDKGAVLDFMDWKGDPPDLSTGHVRLAADQEIAALSALSPQEQIEALIDAGLQIVSASAPALDGTYGIGSSDQGNIAGIAAGIASRNRLPGGGQTFLYGDATGTNHTFTGPQFLNFAAAAEDYLYALLQGSPPQQPITIA